jgi:hypothetical protein
VFGWVNLGLRFCLARYFYDFRDVIELLRNQRKSCQKRKKIPHPSRKYIILCHFELSQKHLIFFKIDQIRGFLCKAEKSYGIGITWYLDCTLDLG